jgi:predicted transposase YbfD/YdcC
MTTGTTTVEIAYGIASHSPEKASPRDLLNVIRNHWSIENGLHWKRDVVLREDRSTVKAGNGARNMAAFRNLVLSLSNLKKTGCLAELIRSFAWDREKVFRFLCL